MQKNLFYFENWKGVGQAFLFRNNSSSTWSWLSAFLFSLSSRPALLNSCSDGTDVAGIQNIFSTTSTSGSITLSFFLELHHLSGQVSSSKSGYSLNCLRRMMLLVVLLVPPALLRFSASAICFLFSFSEQRFSGASC